MVGWGWHVFFFIIIYYVIIIIFFLMALFPLVSTDFFYLVIVTTWKKHTNKQTNKQTNIVEGCILFTNGQVWQPSTEWAWTYATGRERKEDGKPSVTNVKIIVWKNLPSNFLTFLADLFVKEQKTLIISEDYDKTRKWQPCHFCHTQAFCSLLLPVVLFRKLTVGKGPMSSYDVFKESRWSL